ncbi:MAG: patatin-like phospholipase family protein [Aestuariibacter sp.]
MKLGIVFGSGSARGWAHIGVMNELSKMGITPHVVTGTSIGALVGAAVASNRLTELETWVRTLNNWQVLGLLDWGVGRGGLINGEKVFEKVAETIGDMQFEDLALPFGAVATDLYTGREAWLTQGTVKTALRSSCAIPGILAPAMFDGRWMVDGATVNPIPVSLCRALGADFVIAIDLNSEKSNMIAKTQKPYFPDDKRRQPTPPEVRVVTDQEELAAQSPDPKEVDKTRFGNILVKGRQYLQQVAEKRQYIKDNKVKTPDLFAVMSGCIDIMQDRITRSRLAGEPPDVVIQPKLGRYGIMEFDKASELIEEGERCVAAYRNILEYKLEHFIDPEATDLYANGN